MKLHRFLFMIATVVILAGLAGFVPYVYFWNRDRVVHANAGVVMVPERAPLPAPKPELITGKPVRLVVPSLNIDLQVVDGLYSTETKKWTLSKDKVHYALPSIQPNNEQGNTFIYGHYRPEVLARLHKITSGAEVQIITDNGYSFSYTYRENQVVDPSNVDIFAYTGKPQLTIQTCTGAWMQNRQLFFFEFTAAQKL